MYIPTVKKHNSPIFIVGECPKKDDLEKGLPFQGSYGNLLNNLLSSAGIVRSMCSVGYVQKVPAPRYNPAYYFEDSRCTKPKPELLLWIADLKKEIEEVNPNIIIALGPVALFALTGERKFKDFRGYIMPCSLVPGKKVLATYSPAHIMRDWESHAIVGMDLRKACFHSTFPDIQEDKRTFVTNPSLREVEDYCSFLLHEYEGPVTTDIENAEPCTHTTMVGFTHSKDFGFTIPILRGHIPCWNENDELRIWQLIGEVYENTNLITQNGFHDVGILWYHNGILGKVWRDTLLQCHILWPEFPRSLGFMTSVCLDVPAWKHTARDNVFLYNAMDVANTHAICMYLENQIQKEKLEEIYLHEHRQFYPALMNHLQGINIDKEKKLFLIEETKNRIEEKREILDEMVGRKINYNSSKQICSLLYDELKLPKQYELRKSTGKKTISASAKALKRLSLKNDNPILKEILALKKDIKVLTFLDIETSPRGKVHSSYNITGSKEEKGTANKLDDEQRKSFGRWSSSSSIILPYGSGNLQNVPKYARKMYRAPKGMVMVQKDYKQAEAVVVAYESKDLELQKLFETMFGLSDEECKERDLDIHKLTASKMFGIPIKEVSKTQRKTGKKTRHAINYSMGAKTLADELGIGVGEARRIFDSFHASNPCIRLWQSSIQRQLKENGRILYNLYGRKHKFLGRWGDPLFRSAYSFIPQSTVGDHLNASYCEFYEKYAKDFYLLLQLHDAMYVGCLPNEVDDVAKVMDECMIRPITSSYGQEFYIDTDMTVAEYWGDME